ncbi:MAG: hypothetical protein M3177_00380 [Pseudomonadota bacterium]|nr:hypothetical protein [Pseudomonadota bacterium]
MIKLTAKASVSTFAMFMLPELPVSPVPDDQHEPCQVTKAAEFRHFRLKPRERR